MRTSFKEKALKILGDSGGNASNLVLFEGCMQQLVPFVGAGLAVEFGYPLWGRFLQETADEFGLGIQVAALVAKDQYEEAAEILTSYLPRRFNDALRFRFNDKGLPRPLGKGAARHLPRIAHGTVITTNFDRVLERAFAEAGRNVDAFPGTQIERASHAIQMSESVLLKLHGDYATSEGRVLTLSEYARAYGSQDPHQVDFNQEIPRVLAQALGAKPFLFLGCSLKSDRTTLVIAEIVKRLPGVMHFALLSGLENTPERVAQLDSWGVLPLFFPDGRYEMIDQFLACVAEGVAARNPAIGGKVSTPRWALERVKQLEKPPRFRIYISLSFVAIVAGILAWRAGPYPKKSTDGNVEIDFARAPDLQLELLSTSTALELQIRNVGDEPARGVEIEGLAWQMHTAAQAFHKVYSEQEVPSQSEILLYKSSNSETRSEQIWRIWGMPDGQPLSGYFVVTCQNCGHYRAWAFNGSAPGRFSSWPLAEFKYPEDTPRIGQCVDLPRGSCGSAQQIWASDHTERQTRPPKSGPEVTFKPLK